MLVLEKIVLATMLWTISSMAIGLGPGLEVVLILVLIGILAIRELTDSSTSLRARNRVNAFIYSFLLIFAVIVIRRIWEILS